MSISPSTLAGLTWRKSSRSSAGGAQCVELANLPVGAAVRDSKSPDSGHLVLAPTAFDQLRGWAKQR
ncbi:hypothetical protein UO65_5748 [Actinokineospora spheciospongiae]|uniref:DUF397 domain-containing protein n=2 Tax=Actinokineospora spheciospongiae TaxID=909613 RepID=W7IQB3_9PSEU|nr:DUF397 domain-containing protein [Actinokineospora spheciospongiae]EWC58952.1 hypothetical protein UO65_5748 [Actinokineospora spheciospongiae]